MQTFLQLNADVHCHFFSVLVLMPLTQLGSSLQRGHFELHSLLNHQQQPTYTVLSSCGAYSVFSTPRLDKAITL